MDTFDNPSYFTIAGQASPVVTPSSNVTDSGVKPKRFKNWFKLKTKKNLDSQISSVNYKPPCPSPEPADAVEQQPPVLYYNFCQAPINDDDVFVSSETWTAAGGSSRTLNNHRRRHSLGSWFRFSLAAAVRSNKNTTESNENRPSTSSERTLLPRNVSSSANCVRTPEGRASNNNNVKKSRLPVAVKSQVELRARARYARQSESNNKAASMSRIPRLAVHQQTASLDRRYTNSTEVLADPSGSSSVTERASSEHQIQQNQKNSPCPSAGIRRRSSGAISSNGLRRSLIQRSKTIEERSSNNCCGRMAAAAPSSAGSRRRSSLDTSSNNLSAQLTRRRCQRCRDKDEAVESVDVVIIFSRNCVVASQWVPYLTELLNQLFREADRPHTRITSRDVESLVSCNGGGIQHPDGRAFERCDYQNEAAAELLEMEQNSRQRSVRKTVSTASLQIVLLTKALLSHVGLHANDPLGGLLNARRVIGLLLGLDERKDITQLHISALYTYEYWPKVAMQDQDLNSVTEFRSLAYNILCRSQSSTLATGADPTGLLQAVRFKITPRKLRSGEERVTLILLETVDRIQSLASVHVGLESSKEPIRVEKLHWPNPYTITFNLPKEFLERGIIVKVQLKVGGTSWGVRDLKCASKLGEIGLLLGSNQLVGGPLDLMCQALNISPVDHSALDRALVQHLEKKNIEGSMFSFSGSVTEESSDEEFPTLLHFAARFGFFHLLCELLECPAAIPALQIRNCHGKTVIQVAQLYDQSEIVVFLKTFLYVPGDRVVSMNEEDYVSMEGETMNNDYDIPRVGPPKSVKEETYLPILLPESGFIEEEEEDDEGGAAGGPTDEKVELRSPTFQISHSSKVGKHRTVMDEVRDVLEDVKNGKISTQQAEMIFESWKNRKDVIEDAKKREAQLMKMREDARQASKKTEKKEKFTLRRIFGGLQPSSPPTLSKSVSAEEPNKSRGTTPSLSPMISVKQQSSSRGPSPYASWSGSDRSSVASRLSSHDSGAHSDSPEERKQVLPANMVSDYDVPPPTETSLMVSNYVIPPPPRPLADEDQVVCSPPTAHRLPGARLVFPPFPPSHKMIAHPFDYVEYSPPSSRTHHGEDLGRILPNEEPDVMEQAPILLPPPLPPSRNSPSRTEDMESDYMTMTTPKINRRETTTDDYVSPAELNMPVNFLASFGPRTNQQVKRTSSLERTSSVFTIPLPINQHVNITEWRSDPSLVKTAPRAAPRKLMGLPPTPTSGSPRPITRFKRDN